MNLSPAIIAIGFVIFGPLFAARPMLAALALSIAVSVWHRLLGVEHITSIGWAWFFALTLVTGVESLIVFFRDWIDEVPSHVRAAVHALIAATVSAGVLFSAGAPVGAETDLPRGLVYWLLLSAVAAASAFLCAREWAAFRRSLLNFDPGGFLRLRLVVEGLEIIWTLSVALVAVVSSTFTLVVVALSIAAVIAAAGANHLWERSAEVPCGNCHRSIHSGALHCRYCRAERTAMAVSWTGRPRKSPMKSAAHQRMALIAAGRCARCASPITSVTTACPACSVSPLDDAQAKEFLKSVDVRLPRTLAVCAAVSAVPLAGLVVGSLYFRLSRNGSLRRYAPWHARLFSRAMVSIATIVLSLVQLVPIAGIVSVPAICALNYAIDRRAFRARFSRSEEKTSSDLRAAS